MSVVALATASIALLAGPSAAFAQEEGTVEPTATSTGEATVSETPAAPTSEEEATETATEEAAVEDSSTEPALEAGAESTAEATEVPETEEVAAQPQVEADSKSAVESSSRTVMRSKKGGSCAVATFASTRQGVGPPGPGCTRVQGGNISTDPSNPTPIGPINGVTIGIWKEDTAQGEVVHWQILSGTFTGTQAINLKVKGGPDPNGFVCQISNATPTGTCHAPVNPNNPNNKFYGVSFVEACPGDTQFPPQNPPPGGGGGGVAGQVGKGGVKGAQEERGGVAGAGPTAAAAVPAVGAAAGLPVTGLNALWLLLIAGGLLGSGAILRTRHG